MIIAVDPGKNKCGLAVLTQSGQVLEQTVVKTENITNDLPLYLAKYSQATVIVGQGHFGKLVARKLAQLENNINVIFVDEKFSTLEARKLYWQNNKPTGLKRFIPTTLITPPVPVDDYAAVILGRRFLLSK